MRKYESIGQLIRRSSKQVPIAISVTASGLAAPTGSIWFSDMPMPMRALEAMFSFFSKFSDFLGRLQPSKTTTQKTRGTLGVEESSSPR